MSMILSAVFVASLIGSLHCAGMCGGVVALCVGGQPARRSWWPALSYNFGRLVTYSILGAASGAIGTAVDLGSSAAGLGRTVAFVAGAIMIVVGLFALLETTGASMRCLRPPAWLHRPFKRGVARVQRLPIGVRPVVLGLLTGVLPCGWLYAFVLAAAGTGSWWTGTAVMAAFWAGTVPILFSLGLGIHRVARSLRPHVPRLTALALLAIGVLTVVGRVGVPTFEATATPTAVTDIVEHVESLKDSPPPCCHDDTASPS